MKKDSMKKDVMPRRDEENKPAFPRCAPGRTAAPQHAFAARYHRCRAIPARGRLR